MMSMSRLSRFKKSRYFVLLDFIITLAVYYLLIPGVHEAFHCNIARLLGYKAYAHFPTFISGYVTIVPYPTNTLHIILIGVAGGGFVALFYALVSLFTSDWETDLVMRLFIPHSALYAILEPVYLLGYISLTLAGILPCIFSVTLFVMLMIKEGHKNKLYRALVKK